MSFQDIMGLGKNKTQKNTGCLKTDEAIMRQVHEVQ